MTASRDRGRGKVVSRSSTKPVAAPPSAAASGALLQLPLPCKQQATTPDDVPATQLVVAPASASNSSSSGDWRCAAFVWQNSGAAQQLAATAVGTATSRRLLRAGAPLLLPQLTLARCTLRPAPGTTPQPHDSSPQPEQQQQLTVLCSPASRNRFILPDASKNLPGSYYHLRKPETSTLSMSFSEWRESWQTWGQQSRLLLAAELCRWELSGPQGSLRLWPNIATWPHLPELLSIAEPAAAVAAAAPSAAAAARATDLLDWSLLMQLLQDGGWAANGSVSIQAGGSDALLPARYETHDRLLCQVSGRQRLLLLPPDQAWHGLYPYPVAHAYDRSSMVDWEEPELEHYPQAAQVRGVLCDLSPGDSLVIPAYTTVHAQLMQPACVSLSLQLQPLPSRISSPPALVLQASRMVELWFAAEAGAANVRKWLQALGEGREWQLLQPQTVKGYKLLRCCHAALEQLQRVLSLSLDASAAVPCSHSAVSCGGVLECAARRVLSSMTDGRLMPTHWLNEGIDDPLYLQHPSRYYLIEEDAEAVAFKCLFRRRLVDTSRPGWTGHAMELQLNAAVGGGQRSLVPVAAAPTGALTHSNSSAEEQV